jgi:hypothetical protein
MPNAAEHGVPTASREIVAILLLSCAARSRRLNAKLVGDAQTKQ